jgi:SAM-dependent methyltransferase
MDPDQVAALTSIEVRALLDRLPPYDPATALALGERLRVDHPAEVVNAVLTQSRLRTRARERWGDIVDRLVLTPDGAEQATRPSVASHRAARYRGAEIASVVDLGCGIGLDALAFAAEGIRVRAIDNDETTVAAATMNATALGVGDLMSVERADVTEIAIEDLLDGVDAVFADPARRQGGRRLLRPEQWSPPLSWVLSLPVHSLGVKVAPGLSHTLVPDDTEFEVVSVAGDVVEAGLYRGALRTESIQRRATLLPGRETVSDFDLPPDPPPIGPVGEYLFEPDAAVIRAGLVGVVVDRTAGRLLDPRIAYVTSDHGLTSPLANRYRVQETMPFSLARLRSVLRQRHVGSVTVKKRGFAAEPETIRRQLRLDTAQPGHATVVLTRVGDQPLALLVERDD